MSKYPKINAKHFHYHNDGTGRDQYVKHINGGLLSKKMLVSLDLQSKPSYERMVFPKSPDHKLNTRSKLLLPPSHQKISHYYGDGKGRDFFITLNDGGQVTLSNWKDHPDEAFPAMLRTYEKQYSTPNHRRYLMRNNDKIQSAVNLLTFQQNEKCKQLSTPKAQLRPQTQSFMPDLNEGGMYQTYQQLKYQSKAKSFVKI